MQGYNTNNDNPSDPFYEFVNTWALPIGVIGVILGMTSGVIPIIYFGLGLMFTYALLGDLTE